MKYRSPEKRDTLWNTTWTFERIKLDGQPLQTNLEVHATSHGLITREPGLNYANYQEDRA